MTKIGTPIAETAKTFAVDTVLIAVGLSSSDEFYKLAEEGGFPVMKAGDAQEIAEASSAMIGGRIVGRKMAQVLGVDTTIPEDWLKKSGHFKKPSG